MEESKVSSSSPDETTLSDLRELVDQQSYKIDALTALVRSQQITMDRLLRAVEKGHPIHIQGSLGAPIQGFPVPGYGAAPPAPSMGGGGGGGAYLPPAPGGYGAYDPLARQGSYGGGHDAMDAARLEQQQAALAEQQAALARREAERREAERRAEAQRAERAERQRLEQQQAEERAAIARAEAERIAAEKAEAARLKREAEEAEAARIAEEKRKKQEKLNASRHKMLDDLMGDTEPGEDSLFGSSVKPSDTSSLFD